MQGAVYSMITNGVSSQTAKLHLVKVSLSITGLMMCLHSPECYTKLTILHPKMAAAQLNVVPNSKYLILPTRAPRTE
jgi:hypothetical protein